jgi:hypothetical protein
MSPSGVVFDHRLVQTAVVGHANSDHPVILPMDARELDLWRKARNRPKEGAPTAPSVTEVPVTPTPVGAS